MPPLNTHPNVHPVWWRQIPRSLRRTLETLPHPSVVVQAGFPSLAAEDGVILRLLTDPPDLLSYVLLLHLPQGLLLLPVVWVGEPDDAATPPAEMIHLASATWFPTPWPPAVRSALSAAQQLALFKAGTLTTWLAADEGLTPLREDDPPSL